MEYSGFELLWLFFVYSFVGWVLETAYAAYKQKAFVNRGLLNSPVCIIYGISAVTITVILRGLDGIWLFIGIVVFTTVIEWVAGHLIEVIFHERWWDYSNLPLNLDGYICLGASLLWGVLGFAAVKWINTLLVSLYRLIPGLLGKILILAGLTVLVIDFAGSYSLYKGIGHLERWEKANNRLASVSAKLGMWIVKRIGKRIHRAYPSAYKTEAAPKEKTVFAAGCSFYKIVTLFFVGAFLGDIVETIFCRIFMGYWMSRSSVVWGPFSIVWGIGLAAMTALLYKYRNKSVWFLFLIGTLLGGAYEYFCSVFTEIVFGKIFWDYSGLPFNLGGRINLQFCFYWGIAAAVWFKVLFPWVSKWIERIPVKVGKCVTWCMIVFMAVDIVVSSLALLRYDERDQGIEAESSWQVWMDEHYDDEKMKKIYPKAKKRPTETTGKSPSLYRIESEGVEFPWMSGAKRVSS